MSKYYDLQALQKLTSANFTNSDLTDLKTRLPEKIIVNIYGLAGVGKGTSSKEVGRDLNVFHLDSGLIHRTIAFVFLDTNLECTAENFQKLNSLITIEIENLALKIVYNGKLLGLDDLRNPRISGQVGRFANQDLVQKGVFEITYEIISKYGKPVVLDGRGGNPPHLQKLESEGWQVFRVLLDVEEEVNFQRYYKERLTKDSTLIHSEVLENEIREEFAKTVLERNLIDIGFINRLNLSLNHPGSGYLDTSPLSIEQTAQTILNFINSKL